MIQFLVHESADTVGVVVVEDVQAGHDLTGWVMDTDETINIKVRDNVPIGHKFALNDIKAGDTIVKYGHDIGKAIADIPKGGHAHIQNIKTKRW